MSAFFRKSNEVDTVDQNDDDDSLEDTVNEVKEKIEEINNKVDSLIEERVLIKELKADRDWFKQQFISQVEFTNRMLEKLIDKPAAPSATAAYLANKAAASTTSDPKANTTSNGSLAGPKGKLP